MWPPKKKKCHIDLGTETVSGLFFLVPKLVPGISFPGFLNLQLGSCRSSLTRSPCHGLGSADLVTLELNTKHWIECKPNGTKVNIYDREMHRFIEIECPGVSEDDFEVYHVPNGVKADFVSQLVLVLIVEPNCDERLKTTTPLSYLVMRLFPC